MYCLSFIEGDIVRNFYYHSFSNATAMQKQLLHIELTQVIEDDDKYISGCIKFDSCTNGELQRLLNCILSFKHREDYENKKIEVEINKVLFVFPLHSLHILL